VTALFGVVGTVHAWVFGFFYRGMLARGRRPHPLNVAVLAAACECLPIRLFAWSAGHGAVDVPPLLQLAEWGGVPLVSFALLCLATPVYHLARAAVPGSGPPARVRPALVTLAVGGVLFAAGLVRYGAVNAEDAEAPDRMRVAIVQANVGSRRKREATENGGAERARSVEAYRRGSERAAGAGAELVVWPETAITAAIPLGEGTVTNRHLARADLGYGFLGDLGKDRAFLVGLYERIPVRPSLATGRPEDTRYNVAALRQPGGSDAPWSAYRKVFLIPFGEAMPFGILEDRLPQSFRMKPGTMPQPPLELHGRRIVPFICYEGILADHVRALAGEGRPDLLVSLTNDSWYTGWEPYQHLNFTRFRAVEHRAPLVRATNTGISAFVRASGDVTSRLDFGTEGVLVEDVPLVNRDPTLYARGGWRFPWVLWLWSLLAWFVAVMRPPASVAD
jgi:apolipoprotein N-acyltransferase